MKRHKLVTIILRDCIFQVERSRAAELLALEKKILRKEWNTNQLP